MTTGRRPSGPEPPRLSAAPIVAVVRRLTELSDELRGQLGEAESDWAHEASSYDNHPADNATTVSDRERDVGLVRGLDRHLAEARRALEKWQEHSYGQCDRCGVAISMPRLQARPESIWCLRCAEQGSAETEATARPTEEDRVPVPYGALYSRDPAEEAGSDFLQGVMQWGSSDSTEEGPPAMDAEEMFVGFQEPQNTVQPIERYGDSEGAVLWDAVRNGRRGGLWTRTPGDVWDDTADLAETEPPEEGGGEALP